MLLRCLQIILPLSHSSPKILNCLTSLCSGLQIVANLRFYRYMFLYLMVVLLLCLFYCCPILNLIVFNFSNAVEAHQKHLIQLLFLFDQGLLLLVVRQTERCQPPSFYGYSCSPFSFCEGRESIYPLQME